MLFTPPAPTSSVVRPAAMAAIARVSALGMFSKNGLRSQGTAAAALLQTDVRTAPGWLSVRRPVAFQNKCGARQGTGLAACFKPITRAASGWLSARVSAALSKTPQSAQGTAKTAVEQTGSRTSPGWLWVRGPLGLFHRVFTNTFRGSQGTAAVEDHEKAGIRSAPGWLSERMPVSFFAAGSAEQPHYHLPVLPAETLHWMAAGAGKLIIDGTLGGGGHSELFLQAGASVIGIDRDPEALSHASARLAGYGNRFSTWEGNFSEATSHPFIRGGGRVDGWLMDLGVSSRQLDSAVRGFSFMREGPLDMRMGPSSPRTAADIVNGWGEADLTRILFEFGEEPKARRIAAAIVKRRAAKPFSTTTELAACIESAIGRHGKTHPATRAFQAIRMAVNEELESLAAALAAAPSILKPGGLLLIITFHSLEDRLVKRFLKHRSSKFIDDPGWPEPRPNPDFQFELPSRKAIAPSDEETSRNPRARSAKLRVARYLPSQP